MADIPYEKLDDHSKKVVDVRTLMREREKARKADDFGKSDKLRDVLKEKYGVAVLDQKGGPSGWKFLDGSSRKLKAGAKIPEAAQKKRNREEAADTPSAGDKKAMIEAKLKKQKNEKKESSETSRNKAAAADLIRGSGGSRTVQGVKIEEVKIGSGAEARSGARVKMEYVGKLTNGKIFDASKGRPFQFKLGRSEVIQGWEIGVPGMKVGGKRKLTIPPQKAYGKGGAPPTIPPNATLMFDITLLAA
jgi:FK506-binding nuclear protein